MSGHDDFESWYAQEYPRLLTALALVAGNRDQAEEAAAEAFARCLERWNQPNAPSNPSAWTYTVGVNLLRRRWGRRRRESDYVQSLAPPPALEADPPSVELWRAVAALPPRERLAVVLRYLGGLTEREVATAMKVAPGTVAATLSRARADLGRQLREAGLDPAQEREVPDE